MMTNFPIMLADAFIWIFLITVGKAAAAEAPPDEVDIAGYTPVRYCDLVRHPKEYDGKSVAVRATYRYGFEWQEMLGMKCREQGKTWLEFEPENDNTICRALGKAPRNQGTVNGTFYGTFIGSKGPYGDGGYVFRFDVKLVKNVEIVSQSGWVPERLSEQEQQKICQGEEELATAQKK